MTSTVLSGASPSQSRTLHQIRVVLGAGIGMVVGFSAAYFSTLSIFLKPIAGTFKWSRAEASAIAMLAQLGLAVGALLLGKFIDRHGAQRIVPLSALAFGLGLILLPSVPGEMLFFGAATFVFGLLAVGSSPAGYLTVLPPVFDKRLGLAFGLAMLGLGLGNATMPILAQGWVAESGWQTAYRYLGITVVVGSLVAAALLFGTRMFRGNDAAMAAAGRKGKAQALVGEGLDLGQAASGWRFWLIAVVLFVVSAAGLGAIVHLVPMLTDRGMAGSEAAKLAALIGIGVLVGRTLTGLLIDIIHARVVAMVCFLAGALGLALIATSSAAATGQIAAGAALFAFAIGAEGDFIPFFVRRYFGIRHFSMLYGVLFFVFAVGGVAGPILFGWAFDHLHSYVQAYWTAAGACAVSAMAVLLLGQYSYAAKD